MGREAVLSVGRRLVAAGMIRRLVLGGAGMGGRRRPGTRNGLRPRAAIRDRVSY